MNNIPEDVQAYNRGWDAQADGLDITANPHTPGTELYQAWHDGWCEAEDEQYPNGRKGPRG